MAPGEATELCARHQSRLTEELTDERLRREAPSGASSVHLLQLVCLGKVSIVQAASLFLLWGLPHALGLGAPLLDGRLPQ